MHSDPTAFYHSLRIQAESGKVLEVSQDDLEERGGSIGSVAYWSATHGLRCYYDVMRRMLLFATPGTLEVKPWPPEPVPQRTDAALSLAR